MLHQFNKYAIVNQLSKAIGSQKFHTSAIAHAKVYAVDESFDSSYYYFEGRSERISQLTFEKKMSDLNDCGKLALENIDYSLYDQNATPYHWADEIEIGCGIDVSKSKTTYGVCHISPPIN